VIAAAIFVVAALAQHEGFRIAPVDDTERDPEFRNFAAKLKKVALKRDVKGLKKLVDPEVVTGTGRKSDPEEKGWNAFVARWRPAEKDSILWETLTDILSLGCVRMHPRLYVGPYLVWKFPRELDRRQYLVLTKDRMVLRETPDRDGRAVATLGFDAVERSGVKSKDGQWVQVRVNGKEGWVQAQFAHSVETPRVQFAQGDTGWRIVALEVP
jgi:uncharacterized protein YgiM (DUF1202 family)